MKTALKSKNKKLQYRSHGYQVSVFIDCAGFQPFQPALGAGTRECENKCLLKIIRLKDEQIPLANFKTFV